MKTYTRTTYRLYVKRGKDMIEYSAQDFPSLADARVAAKRKNEYVEIRQRQERTTVRLIERVEHAA